MDPIPFCLAIGPVAVYLLLLGMVNLRRRPVMMSGVRDAALLAVALSGLVTVGPLRLLFPMEAAVRYSAYLWLVLLAPYAMCVVLWLLMLRPRLVLYNMSADKLRPVLAEVAGQLDATARWAGDCLTLPALGVQLYIESFASLGTVSLCSAGGNQNYAGWRRLESSLRSSLAREEMARGTRGLSLLVMGLLCVAAMAVAVSQEPNAILQPGSDLIRSLLKRIGL
ncbi:MAG: hypothetical protein ABFC63_07025 [Thermoguttaceae bacterium]